MTHRLQTAAFYLLVLGMAYFTWADRYIINMNLDIDTDV